MQDLLKELGMLLSNLPCNSEDLIIETSDFFFQKFKQRIDLIMKLGFDPNLDDVILLFRSCVLILNHLQFHTGFRFDKCKALISVLTQISSYDTSNCNSKPSYVIALLEVFIKESLTNQNLRHCVALAEGNLHLINELISSHFILSYPNRNSYQIFMKSLCRSLNNTFKDGKETHSALGLDSVLVLLNSKSSFQIPYLLKAHFAVIGSEYFETRDPVYCPISDEMVLDRAINAFESSVNLYFQCLCGLNLGDNPFGFKPDLGYVTYKLGTHKKLDRYIDDMILCCQTGSKEILLSDFVCSVVAYIEESQCIVHEDFRRQARCILKHILFSLLSRNHGLNSELNKNFGAESNISQEMLCLASSLKLMGSSLLQVIYHFREVKSEKEYRHISDIIHRFTDYEANQIEREILVDVLGKGFVRGGKSFAMLRHLMNILMYSLDWKISFLSKGCIFMIMTVMDLIIFEEGSLNLIEALFGDAKGSNDADMNIEERNSGEEGLKHSSRNLQKGTPKGSMHRRSSRRIAKEIQKVKKRLFLSRDTRKAKGGQSKGDKCDGRAYLKCLPEYKRKPSEWDDLVDFIICTPDKDYPSWDKNRDRFRQWRHTQKGTQNRARKNSKKGRPLRGWGI